MQNLQVFLAENDISVDLRYGQKRRRLIEEDQRNRIFHIWISGVLLSAGATVFPTLALGRLISQEEAVFLIFAPAAIFQVVMVYVYWKIHKKLVSYDGCLEEYYRDSGGRDPTAILLATVATFPEDSFLVIVSRRKGYLARMRIRKERTENTLQLCLAPKSSKTVVYLCEGEASFPNIAAFQKAFPDLGRQMRAATGAQLGREGIPTKDVLSIWRDAEEKATGKAHVPSPLRG